MLENIVKLFCSEHCRGCRRLMPSSAEKWTTCDECWQGIPQDHPYYEYVPLDETRAFPVASGTAYDGLAKKLIYHLKYDDDRLIAADLGALMCVAFDRLTASLVDKPCVLVPVPLHWRRLRGRRFNQAELLSREMLKQLSKRAHRSKVSFRLHLDCGLLRRIRQTAAHHRLSREERLSNMSGAFSAVKLDSRIIKGKAADDFCFIVVDDIYTSGATMSEAARTLLAAGANQVMGLAVARALWHSVEELDETLRSCRSL